MTCEIFVEVRKVEINKIYLHLAGTNDQARGKLQGNKNSRYNNSMEMLKVWKKIIFISK